MNEQTDDKTYNEAAMINLARGIIAFHRELSKAQFNRQEALLLTVEFLRALVMGNKQ